MFSFRTAVVVAYVLLFSPTVLALSHFVHTCTNYYLGNGISDATGELFLEAWCFGSFNDDGPLGDGECTRLSLAECFQNDNGELKPFGDGEDPDSGNMLMSCDIESCAMRGDLWDGPIMSCYCQNLSGKWTLASVDLNKHVGNQLGYLQCGHRRGTLSCFNPNEPASEGELK